MVHASSVRALASAAGLSQFGDDSTDGSTAAGQWQVERVEFTEPDLWRRGCMRERSETCPVFTPLN